MLNHPLLFVCVLAIVVTGATWAGTAPELLDQLNDDPSLLLDPNLAIEATPPVVERAPNSTPEIKEPAPASVSLLPTEEIAPEKAPAPASKGMPSFLKSQKAVEPAAAPAGLSLLPTSAAPVETASVPTPSPKPTLPAGHGPVPQSQELVALPGVVDFSVILSGSQFYPARIRMKSSPKTRIIFTTTGRKPAALVFEKLQINRWIAGESEKPADGSARPHKVEEYRELSTSRVTEISFEATPGNYQFYDALSGAAGEIIVD